MAGSDLAKALADPQAGAVDEHVHPPPALGVGGDRAGDLRLLVEVSGDARGAGEAFERRLDPLGPAALQGEVVAFLGEHRGDRQADAAGTAEDERRRPRHGRGSSEAASISSANFSAASRLRVGTCSLGTSWAL